MKRIRLAVPVAILPACILALAGVALAAPTDTQRCLDAKHKAVGQHGACTLKALGSAAATASPADYSLCDNALAAAFAKAEARYGAACRTSGDAAGLGSRTMDLLSSLDAILAPDSAGGGSALACVLAKLKSASARVTCGEKAESVLLKKNLVARDLRKCDARLASDFTKIEAGGACPSGGAAGDVRAAIDAAFVQIEADLANLGTADFAASGRYLVASRTMTFVDSTRPTKPNGVYAGAPDRTLPVTIWYPTYPSQPTPGAPHPPGPLPLVIRAHGLGAFRTDSVHLTTQLASRGMVVVAPDFPLSNLNTPGGATITDLDQQIVDVSFVIDRMLALNATPANTFEGRIDPSRIGVIGHSLGGATVLGAGYHPTLHDARIGAVVALSPLACMYEDTFFDGGSAPLMMLSGTADLVTPAASNQAAPYARANPEKYLVTLDGGLHMGFDDNFLGLDDSVNGDDALACPTLLPPGSPRPATLTFDLPPDFLGGAAAGVDLSGASCGPICPPATATWMAHNRQETLTLASATAMFAKVFFGDVSADRMITARLDTDNADVTLAYER